MVARDLCKRNSPKSESSSSDDIMMSTWRNGHLLRETAMSSTLPEFFENQYFRCHKPNLAQAFNQVCAFVRQENQRYSRLLEACTDGVHPRHKGDHLFRLLLTLDTDSFAPNNSSFAEDRTEEIVNVIHRKRKKFTVPKSSLPMKGILYDFLKDP